MRTEKEITESLETAEMQLEKYEAYKDEHEKMNNSTGVAAAMLTIELIKGKITAYREVLK